MARQPERATVAWQNRLAEPNSGQVQHAFAEWQRLPRALAKRRWQPTVGNAPLATGRSQHGGVVDRGLSVDERRGDGPWRSGLFQYEWDVQQTRW